MKIVKNIIFLIIAIGLFGVNKFVHQDLKWAINFLDLIMFPLAVMALVQIFLLHRAQPSVASINAITWKQLFMILLAICIFAAAGSGVLFLGLNGEISNPEHIDCGMHIYTWGLIGIELVVSSLYLLYHVVIRYLFDL